MTRHLSASAPADQRRMRTAAARALSARTICRNRPDQPFVAPSAVSGLPPLSTMPLAAASSCFFRPGSSLGLSHCEVSSRR